MRLHRHTDTARRSGAAAVEAAIVLPVALLLIYGIMSGAVMVLVFGGAARSQAQVKRVQMHIAGYLCGN